MAIFVGLTIQRATNNFAIGLLTVLVITGSAAFIDRLWRRRRFDRSV